MRCVITGASGFIGQPLVRHLTQLNHEIISWPRAPLFDLENREPCLDEWITQLRDADVIVHLAGLAHQRSESIDHGARYFQINRDGTLYLAAAAKAAGVKRFIFLSSAKVFGEGGDSIYRQLTVPAPQNPYAISKWEAEQQLFARFADAMEIVVLRPPLVYGRNAKANFASLMKLARLPIPLPFAGIDNRRAMIGIDNLVDLIAHCFTCPAAAGKTLLCTDIRAYSLADVIGAMRYSLGRDANLVRLPRPLLLALKRLLGPSASARLFEDFQMDSSETYATLNWTPPFSMKQILCGDTGRSVT